MEKLVKITLDFGYKQPPDIFDFRQRIYKAVTNKQITSEQKAQTNDLIQIVDQTNKTKFFIGSNRTFLTTEGMPKDNARTFLISQFENLNSKELKLSVVDTVSIREIFLFEVKDSFSNVLDIFRKNLLNVDNPLVTSASDVGVPMDFVIGDLTLRTVSGPMNKGQLQTMFLEFPHQDLPDNFFFVDITTIKNNSNVNKENLDTFIKQHDKEIEKILSYWNNLLK